VRYVFGINPALAAVRARPEEIEKIFLAEGARQSAIQEIVARARKAGVRIEHAPRERLNSMVEGAVHQGVVLEVQEYAYADPEDLVALAREADEKPLIVALDGIQDPQNLGAVIRSAYAFGAHGVLVPKDRAAGVTSAVSKASAGALEHVRVARATNLSRALEGYKSEGIWIAAASQDGDQLPENVDLAGPVAVVVGGEGVGIHRLILERSDFRIRIPIRPASGSLNASAAAAVVLYEASRQRRLGEAKPR
jgi:23S rRNA (guanosine2251-2'-O)-methyltransferase